MADNTTNKIFAIIDCNNFYVSCERIFNPKLNNVPVVIMSNNDGCVIARSSEAKALGITMGTPMFLVKELIIKHKVTCLSSNYTLYGDISNRVMRILAEFESNIEVYSIDEAFIDISLLPQAEIFDYVTKIRQTILRSLGIPVSIGVSHTKTLAKLANLHAKRTNNGIYIAIGSAECISVMQNTSVNDVWGIGRQYGKQLTTQDIDTAFALCIMDDSKLDTYNVIFKRTVHELRGRSCLDLAEIQAKQSITCSRSFGRSVSDIVELEEAVSTYASRACAKLRRQQGVVEVAYVFIQTDKHKEKLCHFGRKITLPYPTNNTALVIAEARKALRLLYRANKNYKKAGIILLDIQVYDNRQLSFNSNLQQDDKNTALMQAVDSINRNMGSHTVYFAACGIGKAWQMRRSNISPCYTTNWHDLPVVR